MKPTASVAAIKRTVKAGRGRRQGAWTTFDVEGAGSIRKAAPLLELPASTLRDRMKKLSIRRGRG